MDINSGAAGSTRYMARAVFRQVRFPSLSRCIVEALMFASVFFAAGYVSLGHGLTEMLAPMVPVVLTVMLCSVVSGVYRSEITNSIVNIYVHSAYGFALASVAFPLVALWLAPAYTDGHFVFLFLFATFFVTNTIRPLISGTDFMDGGGRRGN